MNKIAASVCASAAMIIAAPAFADTNEVDVGKITCGEFLKADDNGKTFMLTWIDGYMSAQSENTVMSNEWMAKLGTFLATYCTKNPNTTVLDAVGNME